MNQFRFSVRNSHSFILTSFTRYTRYTRYTIGIPILQISANFRREKLGVLLVMWTEHSMDSLGSWNEENLLQKRDRSSEICFPTYTGIRGRSVVGLYGSLITFWRCIHYTSCDFIFLQYSMEGKLQVFLVGHEAQSFSPPAGSWKGYFNNSLWLWVILFPLGRDRRVQLEVSVHTCTLLSLNVSWSVVTHSFSARAARR